MKKSRKENLKRRRRKTEKLIFAIGLTSIIFVVATYAWFIGTTQIYVNEFEIGVKSGDGLTLSLDGTNFTNDVTISEETITTGLVSTYATHTNHWVGEGLVPISSIGNMNKNASALELYSKTSITSLTGGYLLRADIIENEGTTSVTPEDGGEAINVPVPNEQEGYVAFDLFIKNKSGTGYNPTFNNGENEGIYMATESSVQLKAAGEETGGDGIENSIRIAFMQIGRVDMTTSKENMQKITCGEGTGVDNDGVTNLCNVGDNNGRGITWNIWEPNDTKHNSASIAHFARICKKRTAENTYEGVCTAIEDGVATNTYAVNQQIGSDDNINIYDGLNDYTSISEKLTSMSYFTDTIKNQAEKTEFFYLAPNSVTKIRVYVFLEGQDVDNYDLGAIGKKIAITFGFTKDKFDMAAETTTTSSTETTTEAAG